MKLFTGSLAAGLVLLAAGAQAQVPYGNARSPYAAASDFDAPYAMAPPAIPGSRYRYGPSLLPSTEVYAVLRDNGFSPLGIPRLRGFVYTIAVLDRGGGDGRLIIDARNGRIIRFMPAYRMGDQLTRSPGLLTVLRGLRRRRMRAVRRGQAQRLRAARYRCRRPTRSPPNPPLPNRSSKRRRPRQTRERFRRPPRRP